MLVQAIVVVMMAIVSGAPIAGSCGENNHHDVKQATRLIVGGHEAAIGDWPWMAQMTFRTYPWGKAGSMTTYCSATIVSPTMVLTAGHCAFKLKALWDMPGHYIDIFVGAGFVNETEPMSERHSEQYQQREVSDMYLHPDYDDTTNDNDVAILILQKPFLFTNYVHPICVAAPDVETVGSDVFIAGWGATSWGSQRSSLLLDAMVAMVNETQCVDDYNTIEGFINPNSMICAGRPGTDSCTDDSGGPLMYSKNGVWYQVGITSFGYKCANQLYPGVYTRVSAYCTWLNEIESGVCSYV